MQRILTDVSREGRLESWLSLFALNGLDESGLFSTDVCASPTHHKHVEIVARAAGVLADQTSSIRLIDGHLC